ncbi:MAG: AAA family ATPase [Actinobacteria bacterium]|nr:AAA family ATPase [Actinomycetota bacterium]
MTTVIAVSGKGGTGKTTLSALIIKYLIDNNLKPVLAVDADSNSNLDMALGVEITSTVGSLREGMSRDIQQQKLPAGMSKQDILEMQVEQALVESGDFDLLSMGRGEGPGCYCAINNMLRVLLDGMQEHYRFVVIDNEAGMEHLSRRTTRSVDHMFIVSDPSRRGLETAKRIDELGGEMELETGRSYLVVSRAKFPVDEKLVAAAEETGLNIAGFIPDDPGIAELDLNGRPIVELDDRSPAMVTVRGMLEEILQGVV